MTSCNKDDNSNTYIEIHRSFPMSKIEDFKSNNSEVERDDILFFSADYNITPSELEMDGFYIIPQILTDNSVSDFDFQKKELNKRNGTYGFTLYSIGDYIYTSKGFVIRAKLVRFESGNIKTLDISNEIQFRIEN